MIFKQHYSGSSGNLYTVTASNGQRLMIECGVPWKKCLRALDFGLDNVEACLISHEHKDHCKAVREVWKSGIDIFTSAGTYDTFGVDYGHRVHVATHKELVSMPSFSVFPFHTFHDCEEPMGFVIQEKHTQEYLLFATDTKMIKQYFQIAFTIIAIECSFDGDILQQRVDEGTIHESLARRLLTSHMERKATERYLTEHCNLSRCTELHLLHMSGDNIVAEKEAQRLEELLLIPTYTVHNQFAKEA